MFWRAIRGNDTTPNTEDGSARTAADKGEESARGVSRNAKAVLQLVLKILRERQQERKSLNRSDYRTWRNSVGSGNKREGELVQVCVFVNSNTPFTS